MSAERDWLVHEEGGRELGHYPTRKEAEVEPETEAWVDSIGPMESWHFGLSVPAPPSVRRQHNA